MESSFYSYNATYNTNQINSSLLDIVLTFIPAYILPVGIILSLISNSITIGMLIANMRIINTLPATLRLNFIANAINDLNCLGPIHLTIILGKF